MKELEWCGFERHVLLSFEGPTDLEAIWNDVMGHYSQSTQLSQARALENVILGNQHVRTERVNSALLVSVRFY